MEAPLVFAYLLLAVLLILVGYFITGWHHRLNERINIQRAQLFLLARMSEKQGVDPQEILQALSHANGHKTLQGKI